MISFSSLIAVLSMSTVAWLLYNYLKYIRQFNVILIASFILNSAAFMSFGLLSSAGDGDKRWVALMVSVSIILAKTCYGLFILRLRKVCILMGAPQ